jgi:hypothetical protein
MVQGGGSGVTPLFPDPGLPPTTQVPLPYSANGFRYNVVPHAASREAATASNGRISWLTPSTSRDD